MTNYSQFTEKTAAKLIMTILEALNFLHSKSIVHGDLKLENLVFESDEEDAKIILIDFGFAKRVEDHVNYDDTAGTPYYVAPECVAERAERTGAILKKSDVWAAGVIAYMMVTRHAPFEGKNPNDTEGIYEQILRDEVQFPKKVNLSDGFKDFIKKTLVKSPKQRMGAQEAMNHKWVLGHAGILEYLKQPTVRSQLKKRIVCPQCDTALSLSANFCHNCGTAVKVDTTFVNRLNGKIYGRKLTGHLLCDNLHAGHKNPRYVHQNDIMHTDLTEGITYNFDSRKNEFNQSLYRTVGNDSPSDNEPKFGTNFIRTCVYKNERYPTSFDFLKDKLSTRSLDTVQNTNHETINTIFNILVSTVFFKLLVVLKVYLKLLFPFII
jgi:serine/threonine protein kinase